MSSKKKSIFSVGLLGLATIPIATTVSSTTEGAEKKLNLEKKWKLTNSQFITQKDVINLLNETTYKDNKIDFDKWKDISKEGNKKTLSYKDFPTGYEIPATVKYINEKAFYGIRLPNNFEVPATVLDIQKYAFKNSVLSNGFKLPNIFEIHEGTFEGAEIYSKMIIPPKVLRIEKFAFRNAVFHDDFSFSPNARKYPHEISADFLKGATFKKTKSFFFPFKEIPSGIFENVIFLDKKDVEIINKGDFVVEKINNLIGVNKETFSSLKIPESILKIEKQTELSKEISDNLYEQVEKNIIQDVLKNFFKKISNNSFNKNTLGINEESKNKTPSSSVDKIKEKIKELLDATIKSNFSKDDPNYKIGDENTNQTILNDSPLEKTEKFFTENYINIIPSDDFGQITLKFDFNKGVKKENSKDMIFRGFKRTDVEGNNDAVIVNDVISLFDPLKNNIEGTISKLSTKASSLPSSLAKATNAADLGFTDPTVNKENGTKILFKVEEYDDINGKLIIRAIVKKGKSEASVEFILKGYQTKMEKEMAHANALQSANFKALQASLKNGIVVKTIDKASDIAERIIDAQTLKNELGIDLTTLAKTSTYSISATGNTDGEINVIVSMTTPGTSRRNMVFASLKIKHKSDTLLAKEANGDIRIVKSAFDNLDDTESSLTTRGTTLASAVTKTPEGVGFTPPPLKETKVSYAYDVNETAGTISVTATIKKGIGTQVTSTFTIKGFLTPAQVAQQRADREAIDRVLIGDLNLPEVNEKVLPSTISKPANQSIQSTTVTFTSWNPNNNEGKIVWEATVTKGSATKTFDGILEGYQNQDDYDFKIARNLINKLNNTLTTKSNEKASSFQATFFFWSDPGPNDYGFTEPEFPSEIRVWYPLKSFDDEKGEAIITAEILKGSKEIKVDFTLRGFKNKNSEKLENIRKEIDEIKKEIQDIVWVRGFFNRKTSEKIKKETTTSIPPIADSQFNKKSLVSLADNATFLSDIKGATLTYSHNGITSDGNLIINVKVVKNGQEGKTSFAVAVIGINQAKKDRKDIIKAKEVINQIPDLNIKVDWTKLNAVTEEDPLTFNQDVFRKFGGTNLLELPDGLTLNYYHSEINEDGNLTISINIAKGNVTSAVATFNVNITGINVAKDDKDVKDFKDFIKGITNLKLKVNKEKIEAVKLSENKIFNQAIFKKFGGNVLPKNLLKELDLKYSHPGLNGNGKLVVAINISKNKTSDTASFNVAVTGIDEFKKEEARKLITINKIKKMGKFVFNLSHENNKMPSEVSASIIDHKTLKALTGVEIEPLHQEKIKIIAEHNDEQGKLKLKIKVIPHGIREEHAKEIEKEVLGLTTSAQRETQAKGANKVIDEVKNKIKIYLDKSKVLTKFEKQKPSALKNKTSPIEIGFKSLNLPSDVSVTYELIKADDTRGRAKIRATIKKEYGITKFIDFNLRGYKKGSGKFSKLAIILMSAGGVSVFGILIVFFKTLFKKPIK